MSSSRGWRPSRPSASSFRREASGATASRLRFVPRPRPTLVDSARRPSAGGRQGAGAQEPSRELVASSVEQSAAANAVGSLSKVSLHVLAPARAQIPGDPILEIRSPRKEGQTRLEESLRIELDSFVSEHDRVVELEARLLDHVLGHATVVLPPNWTPDTPRHDVQVELDLVRPPVLAGTVVDPRGKPIAEAIVALLRHEHRRLASMRTNASGEFLTTFPEELEGVVLVAFCDAYRPATVPLEHVDRLQPLRVPLGHGHTIRGHAPLLDEGTRLTAQAQALSLDRASLEYGTLVWNDGVLEHGFQKTHVTGSGTFEFQNLGPLTHVVMARPDERTCSPSGDHPVFRWKAPVEGVLFDEPLTGIEIVVRAEGAPVTEAFVRVHGDGGFVVTCSPSSDGVINFLLEPLTEYTIRVVLDGYKPLEESGATGPGGMVRHEIVLESL